MDCPRSLILQAICGAILTNIIVISWIQSTFKISPLSAIRCSISPNAEKIYSPNQSSNADLDNMLCGDLGVSITLQLLYSLQQYLKKDTICHQENFLHSWSRLHTQSINRTSPLSEYRTEFNLSYTSCLKRCLSLPSWVFLVLINDILVIQLAMGCGLSCYLRADSGSGREHIFCSWETLPVSLWPSRPEEAEVMVDLDEY